jgi:hypothetical protein
MVVNSMRRTMTIWLKGLGTAESPLPDSWRERNDLTIAVPFRRRPNIKTGDVLVYYAVRHGVVFGAADVTSHPYEGSNPFGGWQVDVTIRSDSRQFIHDGISLELLNQPGERDLRRSVKRRSHIALSDDEYAEAVRLLNSPDAKRTT